MSQVFRPHIEGLRAVAILPILVYHLNTQLCPGGYIGVDIFFVISGYLITRMILNQGDAFSFKEFYLRRIYRLTPALLVTLGATTVAGWWILGPLEYVELAKAAIFAAVGLSNFYFVGAVDYFNADSYSHLLLHAWSLGLEEQFYLLWPAFLLLTRHSSIVFLIAISVVGLGSFLAVGLVRAEAPQFVFYLMPFRIFEFAIGASVVLLMPHRTKIYSTLRLLSSCIAIIVLFICFSSFNEQTPWPSAWSIIPCLATAILIVNGDQSPVQNILASGSAVFLGRISYSLYLVHWPLITLYRAYYITEPPAVDLVLLGIASVVLATILFWTIESTFRVQKTKRTHYDITARQIVFEKSAFLKKYRSTSIAMLLFVLISGATTVVASGGFPSRLDKTRAQFLDKGLTFAGDLCSYKRSRCVFGDRKATRVVFVIGDSHALNLIYGLDKLFRQHNIKGIALYDNGCLFAYGTKRFINGNADEKCGRNVAYAYQYTAKRQEPIILAGSFASGPNVIGSINDSAPLKLEVGSYYAWMEGRLTEGLSILRANKRPVIIYKQMYSTGINLPKCLTQPFNAIGPESLLQRCAPLSLERVQEMYKRADDMIDRVSEKFSKALTIDPKKKFCTPDQCITKSAEHGLYFRDTTHLTNAGSEFLIMRSSETLLQNIFQN